MIKNKGFTLIELLVVIAIIGVLSSIVFASLNNSRIRANDAKIKTQLSNIRTAAEIYFTDTNNTYGTTITGLTAAATTIGPGCGEGMFTDGKMSPLVLLTNFPSYSNTGKCTVSASGAGYAVSAKLNASGAYWCVDSKGASGPESGLQADSSGTCP